MSKFYPNAMIKVCYKYESNFRNKDKFIAEDNHENVLIYQSFPFFPQN